MNRFPRDFNGNLTGFGGDPAMNQSQHRNALHKTPVILVHGNGANASHAKWGWQPMVKFLKDIGYHDCELWAMDYLGEDNDQPELPNPHTHHIDEFRTFVDRVIAYLGVKRVDFIAHSLGCGMVNAYLRGLQSDGTWKDDDGRLERVGTSVALAGGTYGLGPYSPGEFQTGSAFELRSHKSNGNTDDSPFGSDSESEQVGPKDWIKVTSLDNGEVRYVAIIAVNDFVDQQNKDTSRREGADLNGRFNLGSGLDGHEKVIKDQTVFDAFKGYFNCYPPKPPVTILVDKASGNYGSNLQITISVEPANTAVDYRAERLTKVFQAGYITKHVAETHSGTLANGQSTTLAPDGAWEVTFSAPGAEQVVRTYGVNVIPPIATIITEEDEPWDNNSLTVMASTTKGILYHSLDAEHWIEGATVPITETSTVSFIAIDADGLPSALVSRSYKKPVPPPSVKATLTEHLIAGRLTLDQYLALGRQLGFTAVITLYQIDGKWVYNPNMPERGVAAPTGLLAVALAARGVKPSEEQLVITADKDPHREYPEGFEVHLSASDPNGNPVLVYYTEDGSDPADARNPNRHRFVGSQRFKISRSGNHAIFCYAKDDPSGNELFKPFTWSIQG